jgi:phage baseplate assembly protein gpV
MSNIPSHDAASEGEMAGVLESVFRKLLMQSKDDMLPAQVVEYDREARRVTVRPLIRMLTTGGELVSREALASVHVFQLGGGGAFLSFKLEPGDLGWVKASDRDLSLFFRNYSEAGPGSKRIHSFSDSIFIPDIMTQYAADADADALAVLQNADGSVRLSLWPDRIKITAPTVEIDGNLTVSGTAAVEGLISSDTDVQSGAVTLKTLRVTGVQSGGDESGVPVQ